MAFDLSFGSLESARERLTRMRDVDLQNPVAKRIIHTGETLGAAFGFALLQARFEKSSPGLVAPLGVPIDLLAGGAMSLAAIGLPLAGVDLGGWEDHMSAIGTGALAVYAAKFGVDMGVKGAAHAAALNAGAAAPNAAAKGLVAGGPAFHVQPQAAHGAPARRW